MPAAPASCQASLLDPEEEAVVELAAAALARLMKLPEAPRLEGLDCEPAELSSYYHS